MARGIQWDWINPIAANSNLATSAFNSFDKGLNALTQGVTNFGNEVREQNTQGILAEAMGINNLADLETGRQGVLASLANAGNGADAVKVMNALQQQEKALYEKQNVLNQFEDRNNKEASLAVMRDPNVIAKAMAGDAASLEAVSRMHDPSSLLSLYSDGRTRADTDRRDSRNFNYQKGQDDRNFLYRAGQDRFNNNLRAEESNLRLASAFNPNAGAETTSYVDDGKGGLIETVTQNPSLADTYATVANNRLPTGRIDLGSVSSTPTSPNGAAGYGKSTQSAVASNLQSYARNMQRGEFGKAAVRTGYANNNMVMAMAAIESGGGDMSANSGQAVGPMQLNTRYHSGDSVKNIDANIRKGAQEIERLNNKFKGNTDAIAIAYNGGDNAADVAYKAWNASGQRGRVADYIPSTYQSKGTTKKYDVEQMRNHAYKYDLALGYLNNSSAKRSPSGKSNSAPQSTLTANAPAPKKSFQLGNGALAAAQQGFAGALRGTELNENSNSRSNDSPVNQTALQMYMDDQGIKKNGGILSRAFSDSQSVFANLNKNSAFASLPAKDQKDILAKAVEYNKTNQGWLGRNVDSDKQTQRANQEISKLIQSRRDSHEEANYKSLRAAAQKLIDDEAKRKGGTGRLPTLDQAMNMINPQVYSSMKQKDKTVNSPFQ